MVTASPFVILLIAVALGLWHKKIKVNGSFILALLLGLSAAATPPGVWALGQFATLLGWAFGLLAGIAV